LTCLKTASTPQKQPPANTAVCSVAEALALDNPLKLIVKLRANINKKLWYNFDSLCKDRVRCLLKQIEDPNINLGKYILGNVRMLEEYELYAGINFKKCLLHPDTILQKNPPINDISYKWNFDIIYYTFTLNIPKIDMTEIMFLGIFVEDNHGTNLFRQDLTEYIDILNISIQTHLKPYKWVFWPYSKTVGWSDKIEVFIM